MSETLDTWLARGDLDELIREIDRRADARDWVGVAEVARRSRAAIERGHQLWPAASYAEYRIALAAPAELAASVVTEGAGWMAPGPLSEVVAQEHSFAELRDHLAEGPLRGVVAGERVVRGEVIPHDQPITGDVPGHLEPWEPDYLLASYTPSEFTFEAPPTPDPAAMEEVTLDPRPAEPTTTGRDTFDEDALDGAVALRAAVNHWATASDGSVRVSGVAGDHRDALAGLGLSDVLWSQCSLDEAGALLAWAASDGAANGRRRGAAAGRSELWWCLAALCGLDQDWPCDPGPDAAELRFGVWLPREPVTGWSCRITVEDPLDALAWALDASERPVDQGSGS